MKLLLLTTDYPDFLRILYERRPEMAAMPHESQLAARLDALFGVVHAYARGLRALGHEAWFVYMNNPNLQRAWAREHGVPFRQDGPIRSLFRGTPPPGMRRDEVPWLLETVLAQVRHHRPDVILCHNMYILPVEFLHQVREHARLVVGQHAADLSPLVVENSGGYDLILSSLPGIVEFFRARGRKADVHRLGFDGEVLQRLPERRPTRDVTFIGNVFSRVHQERIRWLEAVCRAFPQTEVWTPVPEAVPDSSPIRACCRGAAWGVDLYRILRESRMTLNRHADFAGEANNMRLYEATGTGCLLITDWKDNLPELFTPGREVAAYRSTEECVDRIRYHLERPEETERIARAGQERTLRDHSYDRRMAELVPILERHLAGARS